MAFRGVLSVVLLLAVIAPGLALLESGYTQTQVIYASSKSEFPITSNTLATAIVTLTFTPTTICYDITNVSPANTSLTQAHIHIGASNVSGPVFVPLFSVNATNPPVLKACAAASTAQIDAILKNTTGYYFNAHSTAQPAGLFRGQLGNTYQVTLLGANEVPKTNSTGNGSVAVTLGDTYVCYSNLTFTGGLSSLTQGHIHDGDNTSSGPVLVPLFSGVPTATNCTGNLDPATVQHLNESPSEHYVNVHSAAYPAGAARAQLVSASDFAAHLTLYATSASEIPALKTNPNATGGTGNLTVTLDITPTGICYAISNISSNISTLTQAHIHSGGPTESGPVLIPLFSGTYKASGCAVYNQTNVLVDLVKNPSSYYFNAHNKDYPAGVVRAQLGPSFTVGLLGSAEIPATNANPANGSLILTIGQSSVCYSNLTFSGPVANLTQGHIHNGTADVSGPVVVPLFAGVPATSACTPADTAVLTQIVADPTHYYVNIHSTSFPAGVARQQLAKNETALNTV